MSNKTQLQTNNIKLDALITRVNAAKDTAASLPEASTIDEELTTQETLLSDQNAKLAELAEILSNKATGSGDNGSPTISVTISADTSFSGAFYFDENSMVQNVPLGTQTVNALNGIVFTRMPIERIFASGNYILSAEGANGVHAVRFLEDGGTASISMDGGSI